MTELINGKNLDSILEYCVEKYKTDNGYILSWELKQELFPDFNEGEIEMMLEHIDSEYPKALEIDLEYNPSVRKNDLTERFLKNGGFTKLLCEKDNASSENKVDIKIDNFISGDNYGFQSSRSDLIKPATQNANKAIETSPPKRSFLEIASWVIGIIAAVIAIYEFIIKKI